MEELREYVRARVRITPSGCRNWTLCLDKDGYGRAFVASFPETNRAHRLSRIAFHGSISDGLVVMHSCDNPQCVNPVHLSLGTQLQNIADSRDKERGGAYFYSGQENPKCVIDDDGVRRIRTLKRSGMTHSRIGAEVGCSKTLVTLVVTGRRWAHVI
ncbi:hypothetical protein CSZ94_17255 [Janthinobacterium sp. ROICE36]|nr:hypothetical protein CSZ94_17255 [Janthinobacterium sp. ROICE36]